MKIKSIVLAAFFLIALFVAGLTLYASSLLHVYFPATDLQYKSTSLFSYSQTFKNIDLLSMNNGIHWIALPNLAFFGDMYFTRGVGDLVEFFSYVFIFISFLIFYFSLIKNKRAYSFRFLYVLFLAAVFFGPWMLESLRNQINLQWASLMMSVAIFALVFDVYKFRNRNIYILPVVFFAILLLASSGQFLVLLMTILIVYFFSAKSSLRLFSFVFLLAVFSVEIIIYVVLNFDNPCFFVDKCLIADDFVGGVASLKSDGFFNRWFKYFYDIFLFLSSFLFPFFQGFVSGVVLIPLSIVFISSVLYFWYKNSHKKTDRFWLFCFVFCLLTGLFAAMLRGSHGYSLRFSSLGVMMFSSGVIYIFISANDVQRKLVFFAVTVFMLVLPYSALMILQEYANSSSAVGTIRSQVAYSVGIKNPNLIVNRPGAWWQQQDADQIIDFAPRWQKAGLGVFASDDYRIYSGEVELPSEQRICSYTINKSESYVYGDENAFYVAGLTEHNNEQLTKLVFYHVDSFAALGRAVRSVSGTWEKILVEPSQWEGYLKLPAGDSTTVTAVAYNDYFRCQPFVIALNK